MDYDLVVIGGGPAGIYAAKNAASNGLKTILIEGNKFLGGQPANLYPQKTIYDIPNYDSVNSLDFVNALAKELSATNCTIKLDSFVVSFEQKGNLYEVKTNNNFVVQATNILVCTGLGIFTPNEIMFDDENIHYSVKDINLYKNKKIVILGGGNSAVDWANEITSNNISNNVTLIHRRDEFRADEKNTVKLSANKVNVILDSVVEKIENNKLFVKNNKTSSVTSIPFDFLLVQYGQKITTENALIKKLNLNKANKILVDENFETSLKNIYAIGDCCTYTAKANKISSCFTEAEKVLLKLKHGK